MKEDNKNFLVGCLISFVLIAVVLAGGFFWAGYRTVSAGQVALRFGGGPFDAKNGKYKGVYGPGRHNMGLRDRIFPYPTTVRNYQFAPIVNGEQTGDAPSIPCVTKGTQDVPVGPQVAMNGQFIFFLNTGPVLGEFHRLYGIRYHAYEHFDDALQDQGWPVMLRETFRPIAESTIVGACRDFTVDDLSKQDKIDAFEQTVSKKFTAALYDKMHNPYFCGAQNVCNRETPIAFQMKPVLPPAQLADAANRLAVAEKNKEIAKVEAEAIKIAQQNGLSGMAYVANECRKDPECRQHMTIVFGTGVSVATK